jgi:mono/diheme cytochrome c family protein
MNAFRAVLVSAALAIGIVAVTAAQGAGSDAGVVALQSADGAALYQANCASCHQADGSGIPGAFPPLAGNPAIEDADYLETVITDGLSGPLDVLGVTYNSVMPPISLDGDELAAVVAYVQTFGGGATPPSTTAAPSGPSEGDAVVGERLFNGSKGFANSGPSCQACHSAGSHDLAGGSGLGPDLTDVHQRLGGDAGLEAWLASPASPTMKPLFVDKPLTESEISDLTAFLASVVDEEPGGGIDVLIIGGIAGLALLLALMWLAMRRPRETYNQRLRREQ